MEHLTREQVIAVLREARARSERDWTLLLVTFWHGLRASEAISLTPAHFADGYLSIQRLKGSKHTTQPLVEDPDPLLNEKLAVESWLAKAPKNGDGSRPLRLFAISRIQLYKLFRRYCAIAGIPRHLSHPHVLKHSIAMQSIKAAGIENVRAYLGHVSIASTGEYLKVDDAEASAAVVVAAKARKPT